MERFSESDCPSCCVPVPVDLMPDGDLVRYADAQVTIAALQKEIATRDSTDSILATRIRELEARLTQRTEQVAALQERVKELEAIKIPDDAFTYCAYCGEKSPVDEHNEDLAAHIKICPKHPMRDVESQLTQRTAELETIRRVLDEKADCADLWYDEFLRIRALNASQEINGICDRALDGITRNVPVVKENHELHSELERVRDQYADLRKMVLALPKVEGAVVVSNGYVKDSTRCHALFGADEDAALYAALLQHRQGMEG